MGMTTGNVHSGDMLPGGDLLAALSWSEIYRCGHTCDQQSSVLWGMCTRMQTHMVWCCLGLLDLHTHTHGLLRRAPQA